MQPEDRPISEPPSASSGLTAADREQLARRGIPLREIERQLGLLADPPSPLRLARPCQLRDGIVRLPPERHAELKAAWEHAARQGRLVKMVPASGAASRMFRDLERFLENSEIDPAIERFFEDLDLFPFAAKLRRSAAVTRSEPADAERRRLIEHLLRPVGLDYLETPKGLVDFHRYPQGPRTAFEEQIVEGRGYLAPEGGTCRLHFTVSPRHRRRFEAAADALAGESDGLTIEFSLQSRATDTVALDRRGGPFRRSDGRLLFRPAGHGALIGNLAALAARGGPDVVFVKNIDNVAPERLHATTVRWKRLLAGHLLALQARIFDLLERLEQGFEAAVTEALTLLEGELTLRPPPGLRDAPPDERRRWTMNRLDCPLRVCGMVPISDEPGGGPFWVRETDGTLSGQIVETAQIDRSSPDQEALLGAATHFNPVDLVCALRDRRGRPFDLDGFVDPAASFVSEKSHGGRRLLALERPGLWNGAMARWNTAFVEVPGETFTPVKTVLDLLRPEHQPA